MSFRIYYDDTADEIIEKINVELKNHGLEIVYDSDYDGDHDGYETLKVERCVE
jgi:hypothetical protein